jgi:hypothetical protein|tara:strand:+ start:822 stop:1082 length:261 start_codon:yes stop_codon:yes gene_type:complete
MSLIRRIWDVWTNSAQEELMVMLEEFAFDYDYDTRFLAAVGQMEDAIYDEDYVRLRLLFERSIPENMRALDRQLFMEIIDEADFGY